MSTPDWCRHRPSLRRYANKKTKRDSRFMRRASKYEIVVCVDERTDGRPAVALGPINRERKVNSWRGLHPETRARKRGERTAHIKQIRERSKLGFAAKMESKSSFYVLAAASLGGRWLRLSRRTAAPPGALLQMLLCQWLSELVCHLLWGFTPKWLSSKEQMANKAAKSVWRLLF